MSKNNASIFVQKTRELKDGSKQLPMLVWSDQNAETEIYLINIDGDIKHVNLSQTGNFSNLTSSIAKILKEKDVEAIAKEGDDWTYPIDFIEFNDDVITWAPLLEAITDALDLKPSFGVDDNKALVAELNRNFHSDLAASSMNAAYDSIINYLAHLGHDLGVNSLGIDGILSTNEYFRHRMIKHLNEAYALYFV